MTEPVDTAAVRAALTEFRALLFNGNHDQLPGALGPYVHVVPFVVELAEAMNWSDGQSVTFVALGSQVIMLCNNNMPAVAVPIYDALLEMFGGAK